ncbi:MAG: Rrf2 family transcriptional regulator [Armatimonadetes bacterium]|nr:Rrf2 family transcriptional regulator [Armatimonadota bacterium]
MFKLSTRSSYGLRACLALACGYGGPPLSVAALSEKNNIPRRYLEQILNALRRKELVEATRGPRGGYRLAHEPRAVSVGDIVRAVEGDMEQILCSVPELRSEECRTTTGCISRRLCYDLETTLMRILDGTTLEDLRLEAHRLTSLRENESKTGLIPLDQLIPVPLAGPHPKIGPDPMPVRRGVR